MNIEIKWKNIEGKWQDFPLSDVTDMTVGHAVWLFDRPIDVIIKENGKYIVNTPELFASYKNKNLDVMMLKDVDPARYDKKLSQCGFIS